MSFDMGLNGASMIHTGGFAVRDNSNYLSIGELVVAASLDEGFQVGARAGDENGQPSVLRCHRKLPE